MNTAISMNNRAPALSCSALKKALIAKLLEILEKIPWIGAATIQNHPGEFDFIVKMPDLIGGDAVFWVQCKSNPKPSQFPSTVVASDLLAKVLAAPYVSPRMAEVCAQNGWGWFDLAGNHMLDLPGFFRLQHTGNKSIHKHPRPRANLSTPESGRIICALLLPENAGVLWTQRSMQQHCEPNVSLGLVNKVVNHLRDEKFIESKSDGGFQLTDPLNLLFAWRAAYRFDRHQRHGYFTLLQGGKLREALARVDSCSGGRTAYASFSAADFQAPHVRQPKTWLFVHEEELSRFEDFVDAKPVDSGENLVVLIPNDDGVFYHADGRDDRMSCTNAVQTYVDLSHCGGRGEEAAEALLKQRLKPEWKLRGML